jgi:hypothetical protein
MLGSIIYIIQTLKEISIVLMFHYSSFDFDILTKILL